MPLALVEPKLISDAWNSRVYIPKRQNWTRQFKAFGWTSRQFPNTSHPRLWSIILIRKEEELRVTSGKLGREEGKVKAWPGPRRARVGVRSSIEVVSPGT